MTISRSFEALRRANPRAEAGFDEEVDDAVAAVRARIATAPELRRTRPRRRRLVRASVGSAALAAAAGAAVFLTIGSPSGPTVNDAAAAMRNAARLSAASAEQSGTAVVRITHDGELWAGSTLRWNGDDVAVSRDAPSRKGAHLLVVDGTLYGPAGDGGWLKLGDPASIDPDSGTTPAEYLAAVREDVGGVTLRRLTGGMTGLTTRRLDDGSTVYGGTVAAGLVARETGFKEGQALRVLPFGFVAHDEAADPSSPLKAAVTVGAGGVVHEIAVSWGTWRYAVTYSGLGATAAPKAPAHAKSLRQLRGLN
jgi:hypothetical protein